MYSEFLKETNSLWDDYLTRINSVEGDYLIEDGIDTSKTKQYFNEQKVKVLFVLKESNEEKVPPNKRTHKSIFDKNGWFTNYGSGDRAMITKMIKMYRFICAFKEGKKDASVKEQMVDEIDRYSFAFININKHGNGKRYCEEKKIKDCIDKDADLLIRQIDILNPDVIVLGAKAHAKKFETDVFDKLNNKAVKLIVSPHFKRMGYAVFENEVKKKLNTE